MQKKKKKNQQFTHIKNQLRHILKIQNKVSLFIPAPAGICRRNNAYAKFDTQLKNYIDDEVAKLVKKKSKDLKTVADSFSSLKQTDTDITVMDKELEVEKLTSISEAQIAKMNAEANISKTRADTAKVVADAQSQLKNNIIASFSKNILNSCATLTKDSYKKIETGNPADFIQELNGFNVYANYKGNILTDETKITEKESNDYVQISCGELVNEALKSKPERIDSSSTDILSAGVYKVEIIGAGGGGGGGAAHCLHGNNKRSGRDGGSGEIRTVMFILYEPATFTTKVGKGGSGGGYEVGNSYGGSGKAGESTRFTLPIFDIDITALGGRGGSGIHYVSGKGCYHEGTEENPGAKDPLVDCRTGNGKGDGCAGIGITGDDGRDGGPGNVRIHRYAMELDPNKKKEEEQQKNQK